MLQINMRSHVANVHIDGVTVCSDSRDRQIPYLCKHKRCHNEYNMLQISMRLHVANVHIDGVTVCSDSRDRKKSCYNTIDGQITRPICSMDKVHVLVAKGNEEYKLIKVLTSC